jgi:hypothetical protein
MSRLTYISRDLMHNMEEILNMLGTSHAAGSTELAVGLVLMTLICFTRQKIMCSFKHGVIVLSVDI